MNKLFQKKPIVISATSICMLAVVAAISTSSIPSENANEPATKTEVVNVNVLKTQIKQPLAITDDEENTEKEMEEEKVYDDSMVNVLEDDSIVINGGELLEEGGAYIPE